MNSLARDSSSWRRAERQTATHPNHMGSRLHGMARRAEQIELNRGSCTEVCTHDVLGRLRMRGGTTELTLAGGTEGSNPAPSSAESAANLTPTMEHETEVIPSYSMADIGYPLSFMAFGKTRLKLLRKGSESPEDVGFQSRPRNRSNPTA